MKKKTRFILITLLTICLILPVSIVMAQSSQLLDNLQVPSDGSIVTSNIALQNGVSYTIVVSGSYFTLKGDLTQNNQQDAMYGTHDQWKTHDSTPNGLYIDQWAAGSKQWGAYSTDNRYQCTLIGNGSKVSLWIYSTTYSQNSGSLTVQILGSIAQGAPTPTPTIQVAPSPTPVTSASATQTVSTASPSPDPSPSLNIASTPTDSNVVSPTPNAPSPQAGTATPDQTKGSLFGGQLTIIAVLVISVVVLALVILFLRKKQ